MELTMKNFANTCMAAYEGQRLFEQTQNVYNFLERNKGLDFLPHEIGVFVFNNPCCKNSCTKMASDSLYWLYDIGLVNYHEYEKVITIKTDQPERVKDVKIINGIEYVGYIEKDIKKVKKVYRRWFAI